MEILSCPASPLANLMHPAAVQTYHLGEYFSLGWGIINGVTLN